MNSKHFFPPLFLMLIFFVSSVVAQSTSWRKVDNFKINNLQVQVYFNDALAAMMSTFDDFNNKPDKEKSSLLTMYQLRNPLYSFQVTTGPDSVISYVIMGDPAKAGSGNRYKLDVFNAKYPADSIMTAAKTIDSLSVGGAFFQHMKAFERLNAKKGQVVNFWGNIEMIRPYAPIKEEITGIISKDFL